MLLRFKKQGFTTNYRDTNQHKNKIKYLNTNLADIADHAIQGRINKSIKSPKTNITQVSTKSSIPIKMKYKWFIRSLNGCYS